MLGTIRAWTIAVLLVPSALAFADGPARVFYLYGPGEAMREGTPTNEDPTGVLTRFVERDGSVYATLSPSLDELRIPRDAAFRLHLSDREPVSPVGHTFTTYVWVGLHRDDGVQVLAHGSLYRVGSAMSTFVHPGGSGIEAPGWTDFVFDVAPGLPTTGHCMASGCVRFEGDVLVIPEGFALDLEVVLLQDPDCELELCPTYDRTFENAADSMMAALHEVDEQVPIDVFNPLGLSNFDPIGNEVERRLRDQNGEVVWNLSHAVPFARSSWATASTTSDSRLEVRTA